MSSLPVLVLNSGSSSIKFSIYEAGDDERRRVLEGAVDGIGTDLGQFWMKDGVGRKLLNKAPSLPNRSVAFKLIADSLHSDEFPAPVAIEICSGLAGLGIVLDSERNNVCGATVISADTSPVIVRVIPPAEDLVIVNHVVRLLGCEGAHLAEATEPAGVTI